MTMLEPAETTMRRLEAFLDRRDFELCALYDELKYALDLLKAQPPGTRRFSELLASLDSAVSLFVPDDPDSVRKCLEIISACLHPSLDAAPWINVVGHSPVDAFQLLTSDAEQHECLRKFALVLQRLDESPDLRFACPQAVVYEWVKRTAPKLYERIKAKITEGQWEVVGSMWAQSASTISGESLVRHMLLGKRFFLDEFGIETHDLWLREDFGHPASLPQILKRARIDHLLMRRLNGAQANGLPNHTFHWQGIDGTQVLSQVCPSGELTSASRGRRIQSLGADPPSRLLYLLEVGESDSVAVAMEKSGLQQSREGLPTIVFESVQKFFRKAEMEMSNPFVIYGEIFPNPTGSTLSTQISNGRDARRVEFALRNAEFLSAVKPAGLAAYPVQELDRLWKALMIEQSRIGASDHDAEHRQVGAKDDAGIAGNCADVFAAAADALSDAINTRGMKHPVLVVSNLSHFANEAVEVPLRPGESPVTAIGPEGDALAVQILKGTNGERSSLFIAKNAPLHGYAVWDLNATTVPVDDDEGAVTASRTHLENESLRVEFDAATGLITRLFDRDNEREILCDTYTAPSRGRPALIPLQCANQLVVQPVLATIHDGNGAPALPSNESGIGTKLESAEVVESGPVRGAIRFVHVVGNSRIVQTVRLTAGSMRLDFVTEADWREADAELSVAFPVAINSSRASFEIAFGHIERPTYSNAGWEQPRQLVRAQKWADLSEGNYGVALINDGKSDYDIEGHTMRLSLAPLVEESAAVSEQGRQLFTYSLLPHNGDFREGEVVENAYALNSPPTAFPLPANRPGSLPLERSFFEVDNSAVFIESIKRAETEAAVIVRLYEAHNTRGTVTLTTSLPFKSAWLCDLMEASLAEIPLSGGEMLLPIQPFEIVTVKLIP